MLKKFLLRKYQKGIDKFRVNINLNQDVPLPSAKEIVRLSKIVKQVNSYEEELKSRPSEFFPEKSRYYRDMISGKLGNLSGEERIIVQEELLDQILPFYYAMVREAASRTVKMRHFDVQILGGIVLHKNHIAEMTTGEGKTLVATLPASLNALLGRGVHIVTVNDYLARRDKEWMTPVYEFLGLSCGVIQQNMDKTERGQAYSRDITYGTNNEFGFDYLRDNMASDKDNMVQRGHCYAIVDEVDSILIDEARTPLIISGPTEMSIDKYYAADRIVRQLKIKKVISRHDTKEGTIILKDLSGADKKISPEELDELCDAVVEEKTHNSYLTKRGEEKSESLLRVKSVSEEAPDKFSNTWSHYLSQSLRAHYLFTNDKDYIVKDGKVLIVDEFTGRLMPGRRWSDGLHQAVEAKEKLRIQEESQTLATITLQNYFRMYEKRAGMTGTAYTEAAEFKHIYSLETLVIPTNKPLARINHPDRIYKSKKAKFMAVVGEISQAYTQKRPVLVGTASIEDSEELSFMLNKKGISHQVLNAKYHEREAHIVAQAGRLGQITIATNMAGRGTDIILGGNIDYFIKDLLAKNNVMPDNPDYQEVYEKYYSRYRQNFEQEHDKVVSLGGLHVIGTQRHEARRIDNQLRGRTGRQGDPGSSRFYISLEDDLMRIFGSERIYLLMDRFGFPEDEPIEHPWINRSIEIAQKKVEAHNFEIRKRLLEYDNVMNKQREVIYGQRADILSKSDIKEEIEQMLDDVLETRIVSFLEGSDFEGFSRWVKDCTGLNLSYDDFQDRDSRALQGELKEEFLKVYSLKEQEFTPAVMRSFEKTLALWVMDLRWKEHLLLMDSLKEGIHLRGYAHTDPLVEYQKEAYLVFNETIYGIKEGIIETVFKSRFGGQREPAAVFGDIPKQFQHYEYSSLDKQESGPEARPEAGRTKGIPAGEGGTQKVGRNDPCPCGSGLKYKKCCGK